MRVLHVIPSLDPRDGGPPEAVKQMVRALRLAGAEAEIAASNIGFEPARSGLAEVDGLPVRFFEQSPRFLRRGFSLDFNRWLPGHAPDYDIIHVHAVFSPLSTVAMRAARKAARPYVVRPLGLLSPWSLRQGRWRKKLYLRLLERANLTRAAAFHCTSPEEAADVAALRFGPPVWMIPHGVAVPEERPDARTRLAEMVGASASDALLVFLGRIHPKKGLGLLLQALASCRDSAFKLIIAGDGDPREVARLRDFAAGAGLDDRIHWAGFVTGELKQVVLQGADLFTLTSQHENFGIAALEALAAGTPVLLSDRVDLSREVAAHRLGWVTELDAASIAGALREFFARRTPDEDFRNRARKHVKSHFSWEERARQLIAHYGRIMVAPGSPAA